MIVQISTSGETTWFRSGEGRFTFCVTPLLFQDGFYKGRASPGCRWRLYTTGPRYCTLDDGTYSIVLCKDIVMKLFGTLEGLFDIELELL